MSHRRSSSKNVRSANSRTKPMIPKVGGIYESNKICSSGSLRAQFGGRASPSVTHRDSPRYTPKEERSSIAMVELRHSLENLDSLMSTAQTAFGQKISEYQETQSEAEVQEEIMASIAELRQNKSQTKSKSLLQRLARNFDIGAWKHKVGEQNEFEQNKKALMALEMRLMGKAAAMEMLWDAGIQLLDEVARVFESDAAEPFVVLLGLLMSHIRTVSGKRKRTPRSVNNPASSALEPVLCGLMAMASSGSPATMQHQLVLQCLDLFGGSTTKRPFIASLRGQSARAEQNLKLFVGRGMAKKQEIQLLRGAELLHSCTKATMHDAVTLHEVEQLLQLVRGIAETPSLMAAQVLLDQVRTIHEKPRYGASSAQSSPTTPAEEAKKRSAAEDAGALAEGAPSEEDVERTRLMNKYFIRFDLDGCGKLSSRDDLRMLCTSLCVKLEIGVSPERIGELVDQTADASQYTLAEFESWFYSVFNDPNLIASRSTPRSTPRSTRSSSISS